MNVVLDAIVRSSLVLAIGLAVVGALRRQPAALRHWILSAALVVAAAQPVITQLLPALRLPAIQWTSTRIAPEPNVETSYTFEPAVLNETAPAKQGKDWSRIALMAWAAGAVISLAVLLFGAVWLLWLGSSATAAGEPWQSELESVRRNMGIERRVRVLLTTHPALLVTWGSIAPVILLPAEARGWPADRIRLVLVHELAHFVRRDWMIQLTAEIVRAVNWFNPLFWIACSRLRRDSEHACDDVVLNFGIRGTSYAEHLVALARTFSAHGRTWLPAPSIARPSTLERRVRAMLNPQVDRRPVSKARRVALAFALVAVALPIAAASQALSTTSGRVTDPFGLALPDAAVRLASTSSDQVYEARTDASGSFQLADVPPGDYLLSARYPGFSSQRQHIRLTGPVTIALQLQVGTLRETVTVRGGGTPEPVGSARTVTTAPSSYTAPACGTTDVGGNIRPPRKVKDVRPRFKQAWVDASQEGDVLLQALIGTDGRVKNVEVVSPVQADMEEEAIAAVTQWEFTPTFLNCQAIEVRMFVTVSFKLDR
jgi:TonB family protein